MSSGQSWSLSDASDRLLVFAPEPVSPLSSKRSDIEFHSVDQPTGDGLEEKVQWDDRKCVYRPIILRNGVLRGVQMIGSHEGFWRLVDSLDQTWHATA